MTKRWYIVHAYSNFENKVAESIREKAAQRGLEDLFEEVIVPTEKVVEVRRGRKVDAERKFFPGYVLVKCDLTDEVYHLIKNTPKVTGFLGSDKASRFRSRIGGRAHPGPGAGRRRASEAFGQLRDRRAGPRFGRPVRFVQRHRPGSRRGACAPQGGGFDLRPRHAGRARIRSGREGLISSFRSCVAEPACREASRPRGMAQDGSLSRSFHPREVCPDAIRESRPHRDPAIAMPAGWRRAAGPLERVYGKESRGPAQASGPGGLGKPVARRSARRSVSAASTSWNSARRSTRRPRRWKRARRSRSIITDYQDKSFTFEMKQPPVSYFLKKAAKLEIGLEDAGQGRQGWQRLAATRSARSPRRR